MVLCPLEGWSLEVGEGWTDVGWEKRSAGCQLEQKECGPAEPKNLSGTECVGTPYFPSWCPASGVLARVPVVL